MEVRLLGALNGLPSLWAGLETGCSMLQRGMVLSSLGLWLLLHSPALARVQPVIIQSDASAYPEVRLFVAVVDEGGDPIEELVADDFRVSVDGDGQSLLQVQTFDKSSEALAIILALDVSGSMAGPPIDEVKSGIKEFLGDLRARDRVAILAFDEEPKLIADFSGDRNFLKGVVDGVDATGSRTELYLGTYKALDHLFANQMIPDHRVAVVFSDGKDNGKAYTLDDCVAKAGSAVPPIRVFTLGYSKSEPEYLRNMERLADKTGGRYRHAEKPEDLRSFYSEVYDGVSSQYVLTLNVEGLDPAVKDHAALVEVEAIGSKATSPPHPLAISRDALVAEAEKAEPAPEEEEIVAPAGPASELLLLVGGVVAALLIVLLVVVVVLHRRRSSAPAPEPASEPASGPGGLDNAPPSAVAAATPAPLPPAAPAPAARTVIQGVGQPPPRTMILGADPSGSEGSIAIRSGPEAGRTVAVGAGGIRIGRTAANGCVLSHPTVSGEHLEIRFVDGRFVATDLNSSNGTSVNGNPVEQHVLRSGDLVKLGEVEIEFRIQGA